MHPKLYLSLRVSSLSAVLLMVAVKALIRWYSADRQVQWSALWHPARGRSPRGGCGMEKAKSTSDKMKGVREEMLRKDWKGSRGSRALFVIQLLWDSEELEWVKKTQQTPHSFALWWSLILMGSKKEIPAMWQLWQTNGRWKSKPHLARIILEMIGYLKVTASKLVTF